MSTPEGGAPANPYEEEMQYLSPESVQAVQGLLAQEQAQAAAAAGDMPAIAGDEDGQAQIDQAGADAAAAAAQAGAAQGDASGQDQGGTDGALPELTQEQLQAALQEAGAAEDQPGAGVDAQAGAGQPAAAQVQQDRQMLPQFQGIDQETFDQKFSQLSAEKATAFKKMMDGDLTAEEYAKVDSQVTRQQMDLNAALTLSVANSQLQAQTEMDALKRIAQETKASGVIDYSQQENAQRFDYEFNALRRHPDFANLSAYERAQEANRRVLFSLGKVPASVPQQQQDAAGAAPAAAAAKPAAGQAQGKAPRQVPPSLGGLPNAAVPNVNSDPAATFATLEGEAAEQYFASLPEHVQNQIMRGKAA